MPRSSLRYVLNFVCLPELFFFLGGGRDLGLKKSAIVFGFGEVGAGAVGVSMTGLCGVLEVTEEYLRESLTEGWRSRVPAEEGDFEPGSKEMLGIYILDCRMPKRAEDLLGAYPAECGIGRHERFLNPSWNGGRLCICKAESQF
jgi:hypothetical protein